MLRYGYYHISGTFHTDFNLTVLNDFSKITKLMSRPMLFKRTLWEYLMAIPGQSAILNVHQSVIVAKSPNLMSPECTTPTVCKLCTMWL